ncbi:isochorismatase family protein [Methyloceanibacter superfactus]|uniref:isochorismatase family protein n=1 Tax=Methyloceanibacter superfactus TaxID=1774969 RepID=UPI0009F5CFC2|nr:isochorismatase family protein [Methyloceanibacter superfactus]
MSKVAFERDRKFYQEHGLGGRIGFGKKPAVIVIDLQLGFTDPTCPLSGDLDRVVESCKKLISCAHQKQIPVFFTCVYRKPHPVCLVEGIA